MSILQFLFGKKQNADLQSLVQNGAEIIDVRTPSEYKSGHIKGSVNIPLDQISTKVSDIKNKNKIIITCCRSGMRSGQAKSILQKNGIEVYNGGGWESLQSKIS